MSYVLIFSNPGRHLAAEPKRTLTRITERIEFSRKEEGEGKRTYVTYIMLFNQAFLMTQIIMIMCHLEYTLI